MPENFKASELKNPNPEAEPPQEEIKIEIENEDKIEDVAQKMVSSWKPNSFVSAIYDGIELSSSGGDTPDEIVAQYKKAKAEAEKEQGDK